MAANWIPPGSLLDINTNAGQLTKQGCVNIAVRESWQSSSGPQHYFFFRMLLQIIKRSLRFPHFLSSLASHSPFRRISPSQQHLRRSLMAQARVLPGPFLFFQDYAGTSLTVDFQTAGATVECVVLQRAAPDLTNTTTQASSRFPENTLASFEAAMRDGAEGIESGISHNGVLPFTPVTIASRRPRFAR